MKVLIADDEKIIRRGMVANIPWRKLGLEEPLEARNGQEALRLFERERPEILLTDIRMPLMDGVELTNRVREISDDVKIIYMSGYQDIKYIRAAFENRALDYILKPIEYAELLRVLEKAVKLCSEDIGMRRLRHYLEQRLQQSAPFYVRKLLADLMEGRFESASELESKLRFWGVDLDADADYAALIAKVDDYQHMDAEGRQGLVLGVEDILQELLDDGIGGYAFHLREGQFVCLVEYDPDNTDALERLTLQIPRALQPYTSRPILCHAGQPVKGLFNLYESYQAAAEGIAGPRSTPTRDFIGLTDGKPVLDRQQLQRLAEMLRARNMDEYEAACEQLIEAVRQSRPPSTNHTLALYLLVMGRLVTDATGEGISQERVDIYTHCLDKLGLCESEEMLHREARKLLPEMRTVLQPSQANSSDRVVAEICRILGENLACNITIRELSQRIFLTPQYLCALFKQRTGMTINDYVTEQRVERAKQLLRSKQYKLYEIAPMVGYQDAKYFSRVFKRLTGVTPSDYQ